MEYKQLQGRVHEYRVDELSAMANLMMDDYLAMNEDYQNRSEVGIINQMQYILYFIPQSENTVRMFLLDSKQTYRQKQKYEITEK